MNFGVVFVGVYADKEKLHFSLKFAGALFKGHEPTATHTP